MEIERPPVATRGDAAEREPPRGEPVDGNSEPVDEVDKPQGIPAVQVLLPPGTHGPCDTGKLEKTQAQEPGPPGYEEERDRRDAIGSQEEPSVGDAGSFRFTRVDRNVRGEQECQEGVQENGMGDQVVAQHDAERGNDGTDRGEHQHERDPDARGKVLFPAGHSVAAEHMRMHHPEGLPQIPTFTIALRSRPVPPSGACASPGK